VTATNQTGAASQLDLTADMTAAERERRSRIIQAAEQALNQDGEHGLQMKPLADRAGVALATLYRYFPSKDHILVAVSLDRHLRSLGRIGSTQFVGETAGERAADLMLREFRSAQRSPDMLAALHRVMNGADRSMGEYIEAIIGALNAMLRAAVSQGQGAPTKEQESLLPVFTASANDAMTQWFRGTLSAEDTRARIRQASRLLDLPTEIVREYLI